MREQLNSTLLSVIELRKVKSKIFCKPNNLRKSTPRMQLIFISAINIESSKYFASWTFTKVLYLIIICSPVGYLKLRLSILIFYLSDSTKLLFIIETSEPISILIIKVYHLLRLCALNKNLLNHFLFYSFWKNID